MLCGPCERISALEVWQLERWNMVWASAGKTTLLKHILKIQKFCWVITFSDFRASSKPLFFQLKLLLIYDFYNVATHMYKIINGLTPVLNHQCFALKSNIMAMNPWYSPKGQYSRSILSNNYTSKYNLLSRAKIMEPFARPYKICPNRVCV